MAFTPSQIQLSPAVVPVWGGQQDSTILIYNPDAANTVYLGGVSGISVGASNTLPLGPGQSVTVDGSQAIYGCAPAGTAATVVIPGGAAFFLGLTQAQGALAVASIRSPNFAAGLSGWSIRQNGSAEFNNLVTRNGEIIGGTALYYSTATPQPGKLIASVSAAAGTDSAGNAYLGGITRYVAIGGGPPFFAAQLSDATVAVGVQFWKATSAGGPWTAGASISRDLAGNLALTPAAGQSTAVTAGGLAVTGGTTTDTLTVTSTSTLNAKETITAGGLAVTGGTTTDTLTVNGETTLTPQQMSGHPVIEQTDQTVTGPVTGTSNAALTKSWSIPANDAQAGTVYRIKAGGYGVQGSTAETLRIQLSFMGLNIGSDTLPSTIIPASAQFEWTFEGTVSVVTNGSSGTARAHGTFAIWQVNGPASATMVIGQHTGVVDATVNTTVSQTMGFGAGWGSTTGAPTITGAWSTLARVGA